MRIYLILSILIPGTLFAQRYAALREVLSLVNGFSREVKSIGSPLTSCISRKLDEVNQERKIISHSEFDIKDQFFSCAPVHPEAVVLYRALVKVMFHPSCKGKIKSMTYGDSEEMGGGKCPIYLKHHTNLSRMRKGESVIDKNSSIRVTGANGEKFNLVLRLEEDDLYKTSNWIEGKGKFKGFKNDKDIAKVCFMEPDNKEGYQKVPAELRGEQNFIYKTWNDSDLVSHIKFLKSSSWDRKSSFKDIEISKSGEVYKLDISVDSKITKDEIKKVEGFLRSLDENGFLIDKTEVLRKLRRGERVSLDLKEYPHRGMLNDLNRHDLMATDLTKETKSKSGFKSSLLATQAIPSIKKLKLSHKNGNDDSIVFEVHPTKSLSSKEKRVVHEMAEEIEVLGYDSSGLGQRVAEGRGPLRIVLKKRTSSSEAEETFSSYGQLKENLWGSSYGVEKGPLLRDAFKYFEKESSEKRKTPRARQRYTLLLMNKLIRTNGLTTLSEKLEKKRVSEIEAVKRWKKKRDETSSWLNRKLGDGNGEAGKKPEIRYHIERPGIIKAFFEGFLAN